MHREFNGDLSATSNFTLDRVARKVLGPRYMGALDANSMPRDDGRTQYIILNSAVAPDSGHWVAFYREGGRLYYYDSFARPLTDYFKAWGANTAHSQADPADREQMTLALGDEMEQENCGILALCWLKLVKEHGIALAMLV